jgi:general nucleoside transport system permease protein
VTEPAPATQRSEGRNEAVTRWLWRALPMVVALLGMLLVFDLIAFAFGQAPLSTLRRAAEGSWGTPYGIGQLLFKATPLIFTGLAFDLALRAGLFNIGSEGQLGAASLVGALCAAHLPAWLPWPLGVVAALAVAAATGALVALPPALMRARLGVHEIISGIMMNRIVEVLLPWVLGAVLVSATLRTPDILPSAAMPRLERAHGSAVSLAFVLAVATAFGVHWALVKSRAGREMRWVGLGPEACRAEGVDVPRRVLGAMLLSGAIAALAMSGTVLGYKGYYELGLGAGAGVTGNVVAMLGRGSPVGIVVAAVLLGTLEQAGFAINARVPKEAMDVVEAVAIVLVAIADRQAGAARRGPTPAARAGEAAT